MDWRGDGTVGCNITELSMEERDSLLKKKKRKSKAGKDAANLLREYLWSFPDDLPPVLVGGEGI